MQSSIDSTDLSFPVYGWKWMSVYQAYYKYIPLVESPGVAYIIILDKSLSHTESIMKSILETSNFFILVMLMALVAGMVMWFLVRINNIMRLIFEGHLLQSLNYSKIVSTDLKRVVQYTRTDSDRESYLLIEDGWWQVVSVEGWV